MISAQLSRKAFSAVALVAALVLPWAVMAAPFAIQYSGTVNAGSGFAAFPSGSTYHAVLVMDNGGSSAASQAWTGANLTCVYYTNASGTAVYSQNLIATPASSAGSVTTDAGGALTAMFTGVSNADAVMNAVGFSPVAPGSWFTNAANDVFYDNVTSFGDAAGGTVMTTAAWTNPQPWPVACTAAAYAAVLAAANRVPTLSEWSLMIMASLIAVGAFFSLRRAARR